MWYLIVSIPDLCTISYFLRFITLCLRAAVALARLGVDAQIALSVWLLDNAMKTKFLSSER